MIGKQLVTLLVLTLFVFSVPVFAQEDTGDTAGTSEPSRPGHGKDVNVIEKTKDNSKDANDRFKESRDAIRSRQAQAQACKTSTTAECQAVMDEYVEHEVEYLKSVRDRIEANLELVRHLAENYIDVSDNRQQVVNHIKDIEDQVRNIYANIDNVQTHEEAKLIRDKLTERYKTIRDAVKEFNAVSRKAKVHSVYTRLSNVNNKMNRVITYLESKGENLGTEYPAKVAALQEALDNVQENLDLARSTYQQAQGASDTDKEALIEQSRNYVNKATDYLKQARTHLKDLMTSIRNRAGNEEFASAVAQA